MTSDLSDKLCKPLRAVRPLQSVDNVQCILGIDPGASTGVAFLTRQDARVKGLYTLRWNHYGAHRLFEWCQDEMQSLTNWIFGKTPPAIERTKLFAVAIEVPTGGSYARPGTQQWHYARSLGTNIERSDELCRLFRDHGYLVFEITPKHRWTKWKTKQFNAYFHWQGRSSEHSRDATCHAFRGLGQYRNRTLLLERRAQ